ncbi:unnamed protein product [Schistosoma curassoni]|uniref:C2H2-type domain-containing protein n=1 Tax=Schistosoma curassoni TaxID=6186 RepID=A0A3P7Y8F9_9TREM|nr:unnamed protein product [Schistosoma curassoni]
MILSIVLFYLQVLVCPICTKNYNSETYLAKHVDRHKEAAATAVAMAAAAASALSRGNMIESGSGSHITGSRHSHGSGGAGGGDLHLRAVAAAAVASGNGVVGVGVGNRSGVNGVSLGNGDIENPCAFFSPNVICSSETRVTSSNECDLLHNKLNYSSMSSAGLFHHLPVGGVHDSNVEHLTAAAVIEQQQQQQQCLASHRHQQGTHFTTDDNQHINSFNHSNIMNNISSNHHSQSQQQYNHHHNHPQQQPQHQQHIHTNQQIIDTHGVEREEQPDTVTDCVLNYENHLSKAEEIIFNVEESPLNENQVCQPISSSVSGTKSITTGSRSSPISSQILTQRLITSVETKSCNGNLHNGIPLSRSSSSSSSSLSSPGIEPIRTDDVTSNTLKHGQYTCQLTSDNSERNALDNESMLNLQHESSNLHDVNETDDQHIMSNKLKSIDMEQLFPSNNDNNNEDITNLDNLNINDKIICENLQLNNNTDTTLMNHRSLKRSLSSNDNYQHNRLKNRHHQTESHDMENGDEFLTISSSSSLHHKHHNIINSSEKSQPEETVDQNSSLSSTVIEKQHLETINSSKRRRRHQYTPQHLPVFELNTKDTIEKCKNNNTNSTTTTSTNTISNNNNSKNAHATVIAGCFTNRRNKNGHSILENGDSKCLKKEKLNDKPNTIDNNNFNKDDGNLSSNDTNNKSTNRECYFPAF